MLFRNNYRPLYCALLAFVYGDLSLSKRMNTLGLHPVYADPSTLEHEGISPPQAAAVLGPPAMMKTGTGHKKDTLERGSDSV